MTNKAETYSFLKGLEGYLTTNLPHPNEICEQIPKIVSKAKASDATPHLRRPEEAFLNTFAIPKVFEYMQSLPGVDAEQARNSLLTENYRHIPEYSLFTPARSALHPFGKAIGVKPAETIKQWEGGLPGARLKQSCPDFAFTSPFPHKVVFEGKYFFKGGKVKAGSELVSDVYQTFFYRGLPLVSGEGKRPDWDYDYACLLAYDATEQGALFEIWNGLDSEVKRGFWEGANIYIMIIRGELTNQ